MDEQKSAVRKMQDYISDHIYEEISIDDLAKAAAFSTWYARIQEISWSQDVNEDI